jgi:hypothetical protein
MGCVGHDPRRAGHVGHNPRTTAADGASLIPEDGSAAGIAGRAGRGVRERPDGTLPETIRLILAEAGLLRVTSASVGYYETDYHQQ